jgi:DNA polymerase III subunit delta'
MTRVLPSSTDSAPAEPILPGVEYHPHARAVLLPALPPAGTPSHAYLFHGPAGTGKRTVARAFAGALLANGAQDPQAARERVARGSHPDLTWVTPSGASELLVSDIDEPVVAAVTHTPFEATRRVFVVEGAGTMNDQAANRMLKTLEEPPAFAHLILLAEHREDVLPTIASRCQLVRFDPLPSELVEQRLAAVHGQAPDTADRLAACARLSAGDARLAGRLASERGGMLREWAELFVHSALQEDRGGRSWSGLLEMAKDEGEQAGDAAAGRLAEQAELLPKKERRRYEREGVDAVRRAERRGRTATLDLGLRLAELWLRDMWCVASGAPELVYALDRRQELVADAGARAPGSLLRGVELVCDTRVRLDLNVSEELALEALAHRLTDLLGSPSA